MKTIVIFDFDYTIAKTKERIWIWSPRGFLSHQNKKYIPIHPSELAKYKLADDEYIDDDSFKEFYDIDLNSIAVIEPIINFIKIHTQILSQNIEILSARPQCVKEKVLSVLQHNDIDISKVNYTGLANSSSQGKIDAIKKMIHKKNYQKMLIYEDNKSVIDLAKNCFSDNIICEFIEVKHERLSTNLIFYKG